MFLFVRWKEYIFIRWKMKMFHPLRWMEHFHLSPYENILTIALININYLYTVVRINTPCPYTVTGVNTSIGKHILYLICINCHPSKCRYWKIYLICNNVIRINAGTGIYTLSVYCCTSKSRPLQVFLVTVLQLIQALEKFHVALEKAWLLHS